MATNRTELFDHVRNAMAALELYVEFNGANGAYTRQKQEIQQILRDTGTNRYGKGSPSEEFLHSFANSLDRL
ncbi:MAG: hypothetical protein HY855_18860 [Burkholderiales bacterium]|nr:hypothetical protein [Burkholderiales bacterium]